jgi:hypothetical protein
MVPEGMSFAHERPMTMKKQLTQYVGRKATRRLYRAMPWVGGVIALATLGGAIRRKGLFGGTLDTALDFIPFVGGAKNLAEAGRGRDFIRDRHVSS